MFAFWDVTQSRLVVIYRRFRAPYRVPSSRLQQSDCLTLEDGTDRLFRNVSNWLPLLCL